MRESIKVEINLNENASLYPLVGVELDMLDDDGETVRVTARSYDYLEKEGTHLGRDEANARLDERLLKPSFRRDMDTLLRPGLPKFDVDQGAEVVRKAYFKHLSRSVQHTKRNP